MNVIKFYEGDLGDIEAFFRCDLAQASSPLQQWNSESECWVNTPFRCADVRHSTSGMISLCNRIMAQWCKMSTSNFSCEHAEITCFGYTVSDKYSSANCGDFSTAVERIACEECKNMQGKPSRIWRRKYPKGPPSPHVGCRCEIMHEKI